MKGIKQHLLILCCLMSLVLCASDNISSNFKEHKELLKNGKYKEAFSLALKNLSLLQKKGLPHEIALAHLQLGACKYYNRMDKNLTLASFHSARTIIEKHNIDSLKIKVYHNIGTIYVEQSVKDSAIFYLRKATILQEINKDYQGLSRTYAVMAELYLNNKKEIEKSLPYINLAEKAAIASNDPSSIFFVTIKRGLYHWYKKQFADASEYFTKAKIIADKNNNVQEQLYVYKLLADSKVSQIDTTIQKLYESYIDKQDSIFRMETINQIAELESKYNLDKKELDLKLKNTELNNQKKQSFYNIVLFVVILLVISLIAAVIIVKQRSKQKLVNELAKINQQQAILETKEKERNRISTELHDNVGSSVSFISSKIDWLIKHENFSENEKKELLALKESSQEVMSSLRETLWTLNNKSISNVDLCDKLKVYIKKHILCDLKFNDNLTTEYVIPNEDVLALYRCSQEILNNINKHSSANLVNVHFVSDTEHKLKIVFSDNGIGFIEADKEESYGLRNIKNRLNNIGAQFKLNTIVGKGTTIEIAYF